MVGTYKSFTPKTWRVYSDYLFNKKNVLYVIGSEIILKKDSTFVNDNCGNVISGVWGFNNDTLYLTCLDNEVRNDSLKASGRVFGCGSQPDKYFWNGEYLENEIVNSDSDSVILRSYFKKFD